MLVYQRVFLTILVEPIVHQNPSVIHIWIFGYFSLVMTQISSPFIWDMNGFDP